MHILKCYLANDASGRFVTADNAARAPDGVWTYASCSCVLYLLTGFGEPPWFEHDKQTVAEHVLMNCVHQDPEVKAEARRRRLRRLIGGLEVPVVSLAWYCAWCGSHYQGVKYCANCLTGIYSIEEANWRMNYCGNTLPGINPVLTFCIR
ncbi:TPA: putative zinc ribbon protein [Raoultella planticola]